MNDLSLEQIVEKLGQLGLLIDVSEKEVNAALLETKSRNGAGQLLLFSLPRMVHLIDSEYWWTPSVEESYIRETKTLGLISRSVFIPENIEALSPKGQDVGDSDQLSLSFRLNDELVSQLVEVSGEAFDYSWIDTINRILAKQGKDGQFYWYNTHDQVCCVIFLLTHQFAELRIIFSPDLREFSDMSDPSLWGLL